MNNSVVVGYDQSSSGEHTLAEAARAALWRNVPLIVLNAYPPPAPSGATLPLPDPSSWSPTDLVDSANKLVGHGINLVRSWFPGLRVDGRVLAGRAWEVLSEASQDAGLLVVGSHRGSDLADAVLGSVALRVAADSACPVLLVPAGRQSGAGPVVAAVDIDESCDEVLDFAFAEAGRRQAVLEVVHVWEEPWNLVYLRHTGGLGHDVVLVEEQLRLRLHELVRGAGVRYPEVEPVCRIEAGSAGRTLVTATLAADLIVVGARRWSSGRRHRQWIGPVAHTLLHRAECPVAMVPYGPTSQGKHGAEPAG